MADINITANIQDVVAKTAALLNLTDDQRRAFEGTAKAVQVYNEALNKVTTTVTGSVSAFQKLTASFENDSAGTVTKALSAKLVDMNEKLVESAQKAGQLEAAFKRVTGTIANLALYRGFNLLAHSIQDAASNAITLQKEVAKIQAVFQNASVSTAQMQSSIVAVSNTLGVDFKDAAVAAQQAIQSQIVSGGGVESYVKVVGDLAKTTGSTMQEAGNSLSTFMKATGKTAEEAEASAAKLFRTTQLGSVSISHLGADFGKLITQAKELNISEDELISAIVLLSRKGLDGGQAIQALGSEFSKFIAPTEKVKEALNGMDFKNIGAQGGLPAILKAYQNTGLKPEEGFGGNRGFKAYEELSKGAAEYQNILQQLKNTQASFNNAKSIVSDTDADKLQRNMTTIKNALSTTLGSDLVHIIELFSSLASNGTDATGHLTDGVRNLTSAFEKIVGAITAATLAVKVFGVSATTAGIFGAGGVGGYLLGQQLIGKENIYNQNDSNVGGLEQSYRNIKVNNANDAIDSQAKQVAELKASWEQIAKNLSGPIETALKDVNKRIKDSTEDSKRLKDQLSAAFAGSLEKGKEKLSEIESKIKAIIEVQKNADKNNTGFKEHGDRAVTSAMQEFADPFQHSQILQGEIDETQAKIQKLTADGSADAQKKIEELGKQLQDMAAKGWSYYQQQQKKAFEEEQRDNARHGLPVETTFLADTTSLLQNKLNINNFIADALKRQGEEMQKQKVILENQAKAEREKLAAQDKAIKNLTEFSVTDKEGNLKKEYKTPTGGFDQARFERDFQGVTAPVEQGGILQPANIQDSVALRKAIADQKKALLQQGQLQVSKDSLTGQLTGIEQGSKDQQGRLDLGKKVASDANAKAQEAINEGIIFAKGLSETFRKASSESLASNIFGQKNSKVEENRGVLASSAGLADDAVKRLNELLANPVTGANGTKSIDTAKVGQILDQLNDIGRNTKPALGALGYNPDTPLDQAKNGTTYNNALEVGQDASKKLTDAQTLQQQSQQIIQSATLYEAQLKASSAAFANSTRATGSALESLSKSAGETATALSLIQNLVKGVQTAQNPPDVTSQGIPVQPLVDLLNPQPKFFGGPIYRDYGGPVGSDNIPVWGSRGETVMNAAASSQFYSQLMGMNHAARIPQSFNTGGSMTQNNTFNISGAKSPEATALAIDLKLKRARRLGTIK